MGFVIPADPTVTKLLVPLAEIDDRGVYFEDSFVSWRDHLRHGAAIAATLRQRLDPAKPPHVGVLLENTPFFSAMLVAAGMSGIVPVGLNPVRRGEALARDIAHADCQVVLADSKSAAPLGDIEHVNVDSDAWADEVAGHLDAQLRFQAASPEDLFMLIFTSGTSGEPKAVKCSHAKVAIAGVTMAQRFELGRDDVCYVSMPLFHSNAVLVGWAVAAACQGSMALRRKFSASGFLPDVRRYGATYANYVGKPLSYVLATPERPDDADNPLRAVYGNEGVPADVERFGRRFGCVVQDGFGSTEGGVAIARTPDTPPGALGPLPEGIKIVDHAAPDDHRPKEITWATFGRAIAMPIAAGTAAANSSKLASSQRGAGVTALPGNRPHRIAAVDALCRQLPLEHLEGHRARKFRADADVGRPLLGPQVGLLGQEGAELFGIELRARRHDERGHHLVAYDRVWHRVHRDLGGVRVAQQHALDGGRAQVFAVDPHPITKPPSKIRVAVLVAIGEVTTVVHAAGHPLGLGGLVVVVALEASGPRGVDDLADHPHRTRLAGVGVDDLDAVRQWPQRARRGVGGPRDGDPALGGTEPVLDDAPEPASEALDVGGHALVAVHRPQRVVGIVGPLGRGQHVGQRLAHVVGIGGAVPADVRQKP